MTDYEILAIVLLVITLGNTAQNGGASGDAFSAICTCKFLDLQPASLQNLQAHLTQNSFACRPPYLCGLAFSVYNPHQQSP